MSLVASSDNGHRRPRTHVTQNLTSILVCSTLASMPSNLRSNSVVVSLIQRICAYMCVCMMRVSGRGCLMVDDRCASCGVAYIDSDVKVGRMGDGGLESASILLQKVHVECSKLGASLRGNGCRQHVHEVACTRCSTFKARKAHGGVKLVATITLSQLWWWRERVGESEQEREDGEQAAAAAHEGLSSNCHTDTYLPLRDGDLSST